MPVVCLNNVSKSFGSQKVIDNLCLDIVKGEFLTLLGPSGCGKTTVLRLIAGLETCDSGAILINGRDQTRLPACDRDVNTVFQSYALFPHMNVFDNIAFGLKLKKIPGRRIRDRVRESLALVKLEGMDNRPIHQLSGGQQQRVAIARAIVNQPLILLLDEPLSALDYKLRKQMRLDLRHLHRKLGITFVFVTHDQEEALTLSDRVVVMHNGCIQQTGTPKEIYETPVNLFVADFVGESNIFDARVTSTMGTDMEIRIQGIAKTVQNRRNFKKNQKIKVLLRPEDMTVERTTGQCPEDFFFGQVKEMIYKGTTVDLIIRLTSGQDVFVTQFFNEDDQDIFYDVNEQVCISWIKGWEVTLPHE
ncbi:MAG TPA: spermidine/putrescine ABC transporter ATP-binding protein PotA [Desulfotignum sp.]|nr:spermidine/putrescine ABC transporter ATP-binding protein PotA [Desulfotignum sp.]